MKKLVLFFTSVFFLLTIVACEIKLPTNIQTNDPTENIKSETEITEPTEDIPVVDDTNKLVSAENCKHKYVNNICMTCETEYNPLIFNIFSSTTIVYDNDTRNPYGVNVNIYGSDVKIIFY